jgi:hypothetical protein
MVNPIRRYVLSACATLMLFGGMASPAAAQTEQDGLVNVNVEDNEILSRNDVAIGVAAQVAANICGVKVGPVAVLATQVDRSGGSRVICGTAQEGNRVIIEQN